MRIFEMICAVIAAGAALAGIITWLQGRKKDAVKETQDDAAQYRDSMAAQVRLETNISYIKSGIDDIRIDQKAQAQEIKKAFEKIARLEEHVKGQDDRLDRLEEKNND